VICSDKTGTLTQNKMTVARFSDGRQTVTPESVEGRSILTCGVLCSNGESDPTEAAILRAAAAQGISVQDLCRVREILKRKNNRAMLFCDGIQGVGKIPFDWHRVMPDFFTISGQKLGLPVIHLDKLFWTPGWVSVSKEEFDRLHETALAEEKWIMDGNFDRTIPRRLQRCDTVIYLDFSRFACLMGVLKRVLTTYGKVRPDMGEGCPERMDLDFLKWVWNFNKNKRERIYGLLKEAEGVQVIIMKNRRMVKKFLSEL
jgi:adenylate kinase family enzyme